MLGYWEIIWEFQLISYQNKTLLLWECTNWIFSHAFVSHNRVFAMFESLFYSVWEIMFIFIFFSFIYFLFVVRVFQFFTTVLSPEIWTYSEHSMSVYVILSWRILLITLVSCDGNHNLHACDWPGFPGIILSGQHDWQLTKRLQVEFPVVLQF